MRCTQRGATFGKGGVVKGLLAVPCKAMIVGEYSVLEAGGLALALAEGSGFRVRVEAGDSLGFRLRAIGLDHCLEIKEVLGGSEPEPGLLRCFWWSAKVVLACAASDRIRTLLGLSWEGVAGQDLPQQAGVTLDFDPVGTDQGLPVGSSAAIAVGTVRGVSQRLGAELDDGAVYRLAATAHALAQRGGSAYDVAASAMGDWILYERDAVGALPWDGWDAAGCQDQAVLSDTLAFALEYGAWPRVRRRKRLAPGVLIADTGVRATTAVYLERLENQRHVDKVQCALRAHQAVSNGLARSIWGGMSASVVREGIRDSVQSLRDLDAATGLGIYTPEIEALLFEAARSGIAAKVSGAGGGDCVVALVWGNEEYERCAEAWYRSGYRTLPLVKPV